MKLDKFLGNQFVIFDGMLPIDVFQFITRLIYLAAVIFDASSIGELRFDRADVGNQRQQSRFGSGQVSFCQPTGVPGTWDDDELERRKLKLKLSQTPAVSHVCP